MTDSALEESVAMRDLHAFRKHPLGLIIYPKGLASLEGFMLAVDIL